MSLFLFGIFVWIVWKIYQAVKKYIASKEQWKVARKKRKVRDESIKHSLPDLSCSADKRDVILNATVTQLIKLLNNGEIKSEDILICYYDRARTLGVELELVADFNYQAALTQARECDDIRKKTSDKSKLPLLFGIPISVKDSMPCEGLDCTCGLASRCFKAQNHDCAAVAALRENGAIIYAKGNVPQGLMAFETVNNIWGRAKHPKDKTRSTGGSSGGDAGLVSIRGSPLAVCCDLGGSIRIPAAFCGVYGFKPSWRRGSSFGYGFYNKSQKEGQSSLKPAIGSIGKCVDDIVLAIRSILSQHLSQVDPYAPPVPFNLDAYNSVTETKKKHKIGYFLSDKWFPASRGAIRAVKEAAAAYEKAGHEVVEITDLSLEPFMLNFYAFASADGGMKFLKQGLNGEALVSDSHNVERLASFPRFLRKIVAYFMELKGEFRLAQLTRVGSGKMAYEVYNEVSKLETLRRNFVKWWNAKGLDALILPSMPVPAFKHQQSSWLFSSNIYTLFLNLLDAPCGSIPVSTVQPGEDQYTEADCPIQDKITAEIRSCLDGSVGLPLGVQIATLPFEEEKCLALMKILEDKIGLHSYV